MVKTSESVESTTPPASPCPCGSWHSAAHAVKAGYRVCMDCRRVFKPQPRPEAVEAVPRAERRHKPAPKRAAPKPRGTDSVLGFMQARGVPVPQNAGYPLPDRDDDAAE